MICPAMISSIRKGFPGGESDQEFTGLVNVEKIFPDIKLLHKGLLQFLQPLV